MAIDPSAYDAFDAKAATPDETIPSTAVLIGADSQSAAAPSVYPLADVAAKAFATNVKPGAGFSGGRLAYSPYDSVDPSAQNSWVFTNSGEDSASHIGDETSAPRGTPGSNSDPNAPVDALKGLPWVSDAEYSGNTANVATIVGGYDHRCNQSAGTVVGGGHHYLQWHGSGHSAIVGGSNNRIKSGRSVIAGGLDNTIISASSFHAIVGGNGNTINVAGAGAGIVAGYNNTISGGAAGALAGSGCLVSASYAATLAGNNSEATRPYATVQGYGGRSIGAGSHTMGASISAIGDAQAETLVYSNPSSSETVVNLTGAGSGGASVFPPGAAITGRALLVGVDTASGAIGTFTIDFSATTDGSTHVVYAAGESGPSRKFTQIVDNIGVSALPEISFTGGSLRPRVFGKAETVIKWCCRMDISMVIA